MSPGCAGCQPSSSRVSPLETGLSAARKPARNPGLGEGGGRGVRAGEAGDLVARTDELGNKGGADPAGRASDKNTHA